MRVLVVYAHPNPQSFNHAVLEEFTKGLKDGGHSFEEVDLHAIGFDPRTKLEDLAQFTGGRRHHGAARAKNMLCSYSISIDIARATVKYRC